jgi:hypothetical protein
VLPDDTLVGETLAGALPRLGELILGDGDTLTADPYLSPLDEYLGSTLLGDEDRLLDEDRLPDEDFMLEDEDFLELDLTGVSGESARSPDGDRFAGVRGDLEDSTSTNVGLPHWNF